jgi:hypothetical protein
MRELADDELKAVSGGAVNYSSQSYSVSVVNKSVQVTQKTVQKNGVTLVDYTRVKVSRHRH